MKYIILTISLSFFSVFGLAQDNNCLTKYQLLKMEHSSIEDIRLFLLNEGWRSGTARKDEFQLFVEFHLQGNIFDWKKSDGEEIKCFELSPNSNIVAYKIASSNCLENLKKSFSSSGKSERKDKGDFRDYYSEKYFEGGIQIEFSDDEKNGYNLGTDAIVIYNYVNLRELLKKHRSNQDAINSFDSLGGNYFNQNKFNKAKFYYEKASQIYHSNSSFTFNEVEFDDKIDKCNEAISNSFIDTGNTQLSLNNFEVAKSYYYNAKEAYPNNSNKIDAKISNLINIEAEYKSNNLFQLAQSFYFKNDFSSAKLYYNKAIAINPNNMNALNGLSKVSHIEDALYKRSTFNFSYKETNPTEYNLLFDDLEKSLNKLVGNFQNGAINFKYIIEFDTIGHNYSNYNILNSTDKKEYQTYLNLKDKKKLLKPSMLDEYYISSQATIDIDLNWQTTSLLVKSNRKGLSFMNSDYKAQSSISDFIKSQKYHYGNYFFAVKTKIINNTSYQDIELLKYKMGAGPNAIFYSMLMPGVGTLKVTHGQKGWGRFTCFLLSTGIAVGTKLLADNQYKSYLQATNQPSIDKYYNAANSLHKISLVTGGLSAFIYFNDIIGVLVKGIRNHKETKLLRKQLHDGTIQIQNQSIKI